MSETLLGEAAALAANRRFYEPMWRDGQLVEPERFNTWPLVRSLLASAQARLEVAPGLRPRLPLAATHFVDVSAHAVRKLQARGAKALVGLASALPFRDQAFDLLCAFDIVEHVDDDESTLEELSRVAAPGAILLLSVPLHATRWTPFDDFVGHRRRYEPALLCELLLRHGFEVARSAAYGMRPRGSALTGIGMWFLTHRREQAMRWYNRVFMPLAVRWQKPLAMREGMIDTGNVDEVLLICRKARNGR